MHMHLHRQGMTTCQWEKEGGTSLDWIVKVLASFPDEWEVVMISIMPFFELRGALPMAISLYDMPFWEAFWLSVAGNLLPVLPLLVLFRPLSGWMMRFSWYRKFYHWLYLRTMKKSSSVEKFGAIGLVIFTAIPLPTTGAWSACVAASLFDIKMKYSFPAIALGVIIAGFLVGILSHSIFS